MIRVLAVLLYFLPIIGFSQVASIELDVKKVPEPAIRDTAVENWNRLQPGFERLPKEAKEMLYWTNYARQNPERFWKDVIVAVLDEFPTLNRAEAKSLQKDLASAGALPMFILNKSLLSTSQAQAGDIAKNNAPIGHNSTNGTDFGSRIKAAGIKYCANENISLSSQSILLSTILLYLDIGVANKGHRTALLNPGLREIGIGSSRYGKDQWFLVQDFACKQ